MNGGEPIIWAGDHNVTTNPRLDRYPPRLTGDRGRSEFLDIMASFDLKDTCRVLYPDAYCFTFRCGERQSRIDKISVSTGFSVREYAHEVTGHSDHDLIKSCIAFESFYEKGPGIWKNNTKYYGDESFLNKFREFWDELVNGQTSRFAYARSKINWWMDFKYKFKLFYIKLSREKLVFERRHDQILESGVQIAVDALGQNPGSTVLINNYTGV